MPQLPTSFRLYPSPRLQPLLYFGLTAGGLYLLWFFGYERYLAPAGRLDEFLTQNMATVAAAILRLLGFDAATSAAQPNLILLSQRPTVFIGAYCDGMVLYALFSGFVLSFPSSSRHKIWFIPLGIALIYGINVLRIVALCVNSYYSRETVDFNHHYTFTFIVYGFILLLWMWWVVSFAPPAAANAPADEFA